LDAGHIVEQGSFEELMAAKGTFYQQVNARGEDE
jgi:ABC-type multidrug transport system fused ATPase/permease subunit